MSKVKITKGCWTWTAGISAVGYGVFKYLGKSRRAHRFIYELVKGSIGDLYVCHTCDNRRCVNPEHMFLGTPQDNSTDMVNKERQNRGEKNPKAKLSKEDIVEIRRKYELGIANQVELAEEYKVRNGHISKIIRKELWSHI
jgi:hypothetical protein